MVIVGEVKAPWNLENLDAMRVVKDAEAGWGECNSPLRAMGARIPGQLHQKAMPEPVWGLPMRGLKNICGPRSNRRLSRRYLRNE